MCIHLSIDLQLTLSSTRDRRTTQTEPAIDFAIRRRLAFAVVPCCVFPSLFPERRVGEEERQQEDDGEAADANDASLTEKQRRRRERKRRKKRRGKRIASYDDFMRFLQRKHPRMRRARLGFESGAGHARNQVLFMLERDFED